MVIKMRENSVSLTEGKLFPQIIKYTIPIIITSVLQLLFNAADLVVVGRYCGSLSVAAVGATSSVTHLLVNLFIGFSIGAGIAIAQGYGANDYEGVHRSVHTAIPLSLVCGVIMTVLGVIFCTPILKIMNTPENILSLSSLYMTIYFCGITFTILYNFGASILRAVGDTKGPLNVLLIAGIINVILNVIFVTAFDMDVAGVALATIISQAFSAVAVLYMLIKRTDCCKFYISKMHFYKKELFKIIKFGLPAGIQGSLFSISNVLIQSSINSFGDIVVSGNAAAANIGEFVFALSGAMNQTAVNFVGQNFGAKNYKRIFKITMTCLMLIIVLDVMAGTLIYSFGKPLLSIYITDSDLAIKYGMIRIFFIYLPCFLGGMMDVSTGVLRGMGVSFIPMIISILGICVLRVVWISTIFRIPAYHTLECLYTSYPVSWFITFAFQIGAFFIIYRKYSKTLTN